jgi:hypothetical protein
VEVAQRTEGGHVGERVAAPVSVGGKPGLARLEQERVTPAVPAPPGPPTAVLAGGLLERDAGTLARS